MANPLRADGPLANVKPSIPVKNALRLYVTGACRTKREASEAVGLHPLYLTMLTAPGSGSQPVKDLLAEYEAQLHDKTLDMAHVMQYLGRRAALRTGLLLDSNNERIALDASKELMDRSPETQKTQRLQLDSFTLDGKDVAALVSALAESATTASKYANAVDGIVELNIDEPTGDKAAVRVPEAQEGSS